MLVHEKLQLTTVSPLTHYNKLARWFPLHLHTHPWYGQPRRIMGPNKACILSAEGGHSLVRGGPLYLGKCTFLNKSSFLCCLLCLSLLCSLFNSLFATTKSLDPHLHLQHKCIFTLIQGHVFIAFFRDRGKERGRESEKYGY
ncbi:hypothetical protein HJG60_009812 [Phyllostomus discolor]|uniref:Uncharacterized protein n=1 Tax=Phyllostomus discolor TaxID=89673 RepID=A0A834B6T4_9CHIR|nr:hypothetical protein HJG60_009812 [Phyllostomus discolor]